MSTNVVDPKPTRQFRALRAITRDTHLTRLILLLIAIFLFFTIIKTGSFLNLRTWQSMAIQFPEFGLMALGVMLTMMTGGIDLSVVGIANMTSIGAAVIMLSLAADGGSVTVAIIAAIAFALVAGALAGALNGFLVAKVKIPPILVTLGTLELFGGIAIIITGGKPVSGLPSAWGDTFASKVGGLVPMPLIVFILAAIVVGLVLGRTSFGTKIRMLGTNATAAGFSGLNTTSLLVRTYMFSGLWAALAGLVMLANYNSAKADYGSTYTLLTVLIVVLGGVNPNGGSGRLSGVVLAIVILQILSSGLNMFPAISNFYRPLIWGGVLLAVMVLNYFSKDGPGGRSGKRKGE
ncbi:MAG: ABC transporter permease [Propionicimonas sp.]|uniref:ABC transporter permease n=1 Tax=Propionicimonas sp. TaxID=1955623 RepID=UPI002B209DDD|nr:ABC transporter permease [Propionicimonas sp.]MEA4945008.1 ABC transporter permease [Propionicimonas sp.]MEA5055812.1 ABC transporter permease [Propionicimonas sp.]MEA5116768.1 ABC transporter permease [Propionicimonas sp.]